MIDAASAVKQAVDIRDVVEMYGVAVDSHGTCTCPFHDDRHPSASIKHRRFHCFVCNLHLDIFDFVQTMTNCTFRQALQQINDVFRVVDLDKPFDRTARAELSRRRQEQEQKQREKATRNAEYDFKTIEYNRLLRATRRPPPDHTDIGAYAAALGRLQQLDYWFEHHRFER